MGSKFAHAQVVQHALPTSTRRPAVDGVLAAAVEVTSCLRPAPTDFPPGLGWPEEDAALPSTTERLRQLLWPTGRAVDRAPSSCEVFDFRPKEKPAARVCGWQSYASSPGRWVPESSGSDRSHACESSEPLCCGAYELDGVPSNCPWPDGVRVLGVLVHVNPFIPWRCATEQ